MIELQKFIFVVSQRLCTLTMATTAPDIAKKRKAKDLPVELLAFNESNFHKQIKARLETDTKESGEVMVAFEITVAACNGTYDLTTLTLDQLRKFSKNVGCQYVNKCTKFQCRKALWVLAQYQNKREKDGLDVSTPTSNKSTCNVIRLTNIIFSHEFLDSYLKLNDAKTRVDHESGEIPKNFWHDVAESMNGSDNDDDTALKIVLDEDDRHYDEIADVDLTEFDLMTATAIKKNEPATSCQSTSAEKYDC